MFDASLLGRLASWDQLRGGDGLLGGIGNQVADGFTNNRNAIMLASMGLLSGQGPQDAWVNAMKGFAAGAASDRARARSERTAADAAKRQAAFRNLFAGRPDLAQAAAADDDLGRALAVDRFKAPTYAQVDLGDRIGFVDPRDPTKIVGTVGKAAKPGRDRARGNGFGYDSAR